MIVSECTKLLDVYVNKVGSQLASILSNTAGYTVSLTEGSGIENMWARRGIGSGESSGWGITDIVKQEMGVDNESIATRQRDCAHHQEPN